MEYYRIPLKVAYAPIYATLPTNESLSLVFEGSMVLVEMLEICLLIFLLVSIFLFLLVLDEGCLNSTNVSHKVNPSLSKKFFIDVIGPFGSNPWALPSEHIST